MLTIINYKKLLTSLTHVYNFEKNIVNYKINNIFFQLPNKNLPNVP